MQYFLVLLVLRLSQAKLGFAYGYGYAIVRNLTAPVKPVDVSNANANGLLWLFFGKIGEFDTTQERWENYHEIL